MKRMYEKLMAYEEAFVANEYVATCYGLACSVGFGNSGDKGNKWKYDEKDSVFHEHDFVSGTCTDASANRVITNDGSVVKSVSEYNKDQGWLDGGFDYWDDRNNNGIVDTKDGIYWHTESKKPIIGDSHLQTDVGIIMVYQHLQILVVLIILKFYKLKSR